jgi:hypothetical protein
MINWVKIFNNFLFFKLFRVIVTNLSMKHYLKIMHTAYCVTRVLSRRCNDYNVMLDITLYLFLHIGGQTEELYIIFCKQTMHYL